MSDVEMYDMDNPLVNTQRDGKPGSLKRYIPTACLSITSFILLILWLSESQFSQGILRTRNINETCEWDLVFNRKCSPGLICQRDICVLPPPTICPTPNCTDLYIQTPCPSLAIHPNSQSVYDYNEQPGSRTDAGSHGYYRTVYNIDYSGCKGLCNIQEKCKMVNYQNLARNCWMAEKYLVPSKRDPEWTTAIKILHT